MLLQWYCNAVAVASFSRICKKNFVGSKKKCNFANSKKIGYCPVV